MGGIAWLARPIQMSNWTLQVLLEDLDERVPNEGGGETCSGLWQEYQYSCGPSRYMYGTVHVRYGTCGRQLTKSSLL
jgi:hypothetical protein